MLPVRVVQVRSSPRRAVLRPAPGRSRRAGQATKAFAPNRVPRCAPHCSRLSHKQTSQAVNQPLRPMHKSAEQFYRQRHIRRCTPQRRALQDTRGSKTGRLRTAGYRARAPLQLERRNQATAFAFQATSPRRATRLPTMLLLSARAKGQQQVIQRMARVHRDRFARQKALRARSQEASARSQ